MSATVSRLVSGTEAQLHRTDEGTPGADSDILNERYVKGNRATNPCCVTQCLRARTQQFTSTSLSREKLVRKSETI